MATPLLDLPGTAGLHPGRRPARRWALLAVALGTFMTYLDNNIINVAIPTIQRSLHLSESGIEWVVSAYILLFAGLLLAGGRLADVFGRRRLFFAGLVVFTAASLLAGLSHSVDVLIASRALQGLGAALLTPTTLAIITALFPTPRSRPGRLASGARSVRWPWRSGRCSAVCSPRTPTGTGSSSSTCPSAW